MINNNHKIAVSSKPEALCVETHLLSQHLELKTFVKAENLIYAAFKVLNQWAGAIAEEGESS